jgi:hypothetical protein
VCVCVCWGGCGGDGVVVAFGYFGCGRSAGFDVLAFGSNSVHNQRCRLGSANAIEAFAGGVVVGGGGGGITLVDMDSAGSTAMRLSVHKSQASVT